jgi:hypothetical protein
VITNVNSDWSVSLTIDMLPPSVNHYKEPIKIRTSTGLRTSFALTPEAILFRDLVWIASRTCGTIAPDPMDKKLRREVRYALYVTLYLGKGERGDGDNFWKCIADSVAHAGIIHSDARVRRWCLDVEDCDRENPRTEITAERIERRTK